MPPMATRGVQPLTAQLRRVLRAHAVSERTGAPVDDVLGSAAERAAAAESAGPSRRDVLRGAGALAAAGTLAGAVPARRANAATAPSVVVVGAGLAGLRAAHYLS